MNKIIRLAALLSIILLMAACGGDDGESQPTLENIQIDVSNAQTSYLYGATLDISQLLASSHFSDGSIVDFDIKLSDITDFNSQIIGVQTLTLSHQGKTASFTVEILKGSLSRIEVDATEAKKQYLYNEGLDIKGLTAQAEYESGYKEAININTTDISGFDNHTLGSQTLTLSYAEKNANFTVKVVKGGLNAMTLDTTNAKLAYMYNDALDIKGLTAQAEYESGFKEQISFTSEAITGFDKLSIGSQTLTLSHEGKASSYVVEVVKGSFSGIELDATNAKKLYQYGDKLDIDGLAAKAVYESGFKQAINIYASNISDYDPHQTGIQQLKFSFENEVAYYDIELVSFKYEEVANGIKVTGLVHAAKYNIPDLIIPEYIAGQRVVAIGDYAFSYQHLTSVDIPDGITSIGASAFHYNQLISVDIPESVTSIGSSAFSNNFLTSVNIPKGLTSIAAYTFRENVLTSVAIPEGITSINMSAFARNQLTSVTIPSSVTYIGSAAFNTNQISELNGEANDGIIYARDAGGAWDDSTIVSYGGATTVIDFIPANVTNIAASAFDDNKLISVLIPTGITSIGDDAFSGNRLTSVVIPEGVTSINARAFSFNLLTDIDIPTSVTSIDRYAFAYNELTHVDIPDGVSSIGSGSFFENKITNVTIPDCVIGIGWSAFNSNRITELNGELSNGIIYARDANRLWDNSTIVSYGGAASVIDFIPASVISIGEGAFSNGKITSVALPESVTSITSGAFSNNKNAAGNTIMVQLYGAVGSIAESYPETSSSVVYAGEAP